jgi:hypothetical protein
MKLWAVLITKLILLRYLAGPHAANERMLFEATV